MKTRTFYGHLMIGIAVAMTLPACTKWVVIYQNPSFDARSMDRIEVTPVVDGRRRVVEKANYDKAVKPLQQRIAKLLKKRGYDSVLATHFGTRGALDADQIAFADPDTIRQLGTGQTPWVFVPVVDDYFKIGGMVSTTTSEMTAYLFNRSTGELVWEGSGMKKELKEAITDVINQLPKRKR